MAASSNFSNGSAYCNDTQNGGHVFFGTVLATEFVLALLSTPLNVIFLFAIFKPIIKLSLNLRLILAHLSFNLLTYSGAIFAKATRIASGRGSYSDACLLGRNFYCRVQETIIAVLISNITYSLALISIEIIIAEWRKSKNQSRDGGGASSARRKPISAVVLIAATWTMSLGCQLVIFMEIDQSTSWCEKAIKGNGAKAILITNVITEVITALLSVVVFIRYYLLKRKRVGQIGNASLAETQNQNPKVNRFLVRLIVLHCFCNLPRDLFACFVLNHSKTLFQTELTIVHTHDILHLIYSSILPLSIFAIDFPMRSKLIDLVPAKLINRFRKEETNATEYTPSAPIASTLIAPCISAYTLNHFDVLQKMWAMPKNDEQ